MKNLSGGVVAPPPGQNGTVVGTRGGSSVGYCYCDIQYPNEPIQCEQPCPVSVCDYANSN